MWLWLRYKYNLQKRSDLYLNVFMPKSEIIITHVLFYKIS